jgi:predicted aminopeptidase
VRSLLTLLGVLGLAGCQAGYYAHLARGQFELLSRREPIEQVIERENLDATVKHRLQRAVNAREFATRHLGLPDNGSYRQYADLQRPYAAWNVFATPALSLAPREWCYPFMGCMAYRGYYDVERAKAEADALRAAGFDVHVGGVPAYSTLGWFADPVLNTILGSEEGVVGTIFHELAHQRQFVKGDSAFNESFATFIEHEGLRQYYRDEPERLERLARRQRRDREFVGLMLTTRARLVALYGQKLSPEEMGLRKTEEIARLRQEYEVAKEKWGDNAYDGWMSGEINNARLLPFGLYHAWEPAFATLYQRAGRDWPTFYRAVATIAETAPAERRRRMEALSVDAERG